MARAKDVIEGLQVLLQYDSELEVVAEHDEIYAGHGIETVREEHDYYLHELGWRWDPNVPAWRKDAS